jgi:hypothetical protein
LLFLFLPEREILLEELDDRLGVSEGFFINVIDLLEGIRECGFTKFTGLFMVVHHFVMEYGEVESKTKSDWVASVEGLGGALGELIVLEGSTFDGLELIRSGTLSNVSVVISNHLVEEGLGFVGAGNLHALIHNDINDSDALFIELSFDLFLVSTKAILELDVLWILLNGTDGPDSSSLGSNLVLEANRQQVSLLSGEILLFALHNLLEVIHHIVESFGLFSDSSHENVFFQTHL